MNSITLARFNAKYVISSNGCWEWIGGRNRDGYGKMKVEGKNRQAHVLAYEHYVGFVPQGKELDHLCRNRWCCNFKHLEAVTHRVNVYRGVAPSSVNAKKTHCPRGHEYTEQNTRIINGRRHCNTCEGYNGLGKGGYEKAKTHCSQGHEYTIENTHVRPNGKRRCRMCDKIRHAERRNRLPIS